MSLWEILGSNVLRKKTVLSSRSFKRFFKLSNNLVNAIYTKIITSGYFCKRIHLLWTLYYLRTTNTYDNEISTTLGIAPNTMKIQVIKVLRLILRSLPQV